MLPKKHPVRVSGICVLGIVAVCALCSLPTAGAAEAGFVEISPPAGQRGDAPSREELRDWRVWLVEQGFDIGRCGHDPAGGLIGLDVQSQEQLDRLTDVGFTVVREHQGGPLEDGSRTDSQYYDAGEILTILVQTANAHPEIARVIPIATTYEGRPIWGLEISDNPGIDEDEPAIQFNGQHHAREVATPHVVVDVIETLTDGYGVDPDVTNWVNSYKTVCVPTANPDGTQYVFSTDSYWRKNRQLHSCIGVDLNRNYPYQWGPAGCGSSSTCTSSTYRGPSAASDIETQAMIALAQQYHFVMATSYHAYGRFIDYPYACYNGSPSGRMPEHDVTAQMMDQMAAAIYSYVPNVAYTSYTSASAGPLSGDDTSWYYAHMGTYAFIVEIGTSFEPSFSSVPDIVGRNREGWKYLYERLGQARIDVHVVDTCTGLPLEAEVTLTDYVFDTQELPRITFLPFGRWTFMVMPNDTYTVRVSKAGYMTQDVPVAVGNLPTAVNVELEPSTPPAYGDANCDGVVDGIDLAVFVDCVSGPGQTITPTPPYTWDRCLARFDSESDGDIDLYDFAMFQRSFD